MSRMHSIGRGQRGNALVEYALLLSLVALAVVGGLTFFGQSVSADVGIVADEIASVFGSAGSGSAGSGHGHGAGNGGHNNGAGNGGQDNGNGNGK
jgi:Flp pilus assembly pilin Flp